MVGDLEKLVRRNTLEIWRNVVGDLEKPVWQSTLEIWRNVVGNLEKPIRRNTLEIWRNMVGNLEKLVRQKRWRFGETCAAIWRNLFGENVGDLEKRGRRSYGDFILEFVME